MVTIDPIELGKWIRGETEHGRWRRAALGIWYNHMPKLFGWTLSPMRLVFGLVRGLCFLAVSLSPVWLKYAAAPEAISWTEALLYSSLLTLILGYNFFYDKIIRDYRPKSIAQKLRTRLSLEHCGVTSNLTGVLKLRKKEGQPTIDGAMIKMLECIRDAARIQLGDYEGAHVEATLLLFDDPKCATIKVVNRTTHSRPTGRVKASEEVMAFHVAKSRKHRVVNDFMSDGHPFPKQGLSGDIPSYRSILMIPLLDAQPGEQDTCIGVVTVDSSRPYHFWPGNGEDVVVQLKPFIVLLTFFLNLGSPHRLSCPQS